ncbi:hypothetical protein HRD57_04140 [Tetragenococcus halophilus]|nr:hypothetical protein [Tetragenococcus halophilus]
MQESKQNTKYIRYITFMAAFSALAYISVIFLKIPMIVFLKYEPKDVFVILGGLIFYHYSLSFYQLLCHSLS